MRPTFDERDAKIRERNLASWNHIPSPRVGDFVRFADGETLRISYVYDWLDVPAFQVSRGGSWHLGDGYCSFSGALLRSTPLSTLTLTDETRDGLVWFFHHDYPQAHHGVDTHVPCRVYVCTENTPE